VQQVIAALFGSGMQSAMALIGALAMLSTLPAKAQPLDLQSGALEEQLMSCLTLKASDAQVIGYPAREEAMRTEGSVRVRMEFTGPGDAPNVDVLFASTASCVRMFAPIAFLACLQVTRRWWRSRSLHSIREVAPRSTGASLGKLSQ
jgi:hypothetical protein